MKTPDTTKNAVSSAADQGALIFACGALPAKTRTVTAEVLARLLNHERLTGLETVFNASTTRLAAVVFRLQSRYGWVIAREDKAVGCKDGRVAWVSEYWLPPETVAAAMAGGAGEWCARVRADRRALKIKAGLAARAAARKRAARNHRAHHGQAGLFEGG